MRGHHPPQEEEQMPSLDDRMKDRRMLDEVRAEIDADKQRRESRIRKELFGADAVDRLAAMVKGDENWDALPVEVFGFGPGLGFVRFVFADGAVVNLKLDAS